MSNVEDHVVRLREARISREKARITKLRELNLKKYNQNALPVLKNPPPKILKSSSVSMMKEKLPVVKNNSHLNCTRRPITAPIPKNEVNCKKSDDPKTRATTNNFVSKPHAVKTDGHVASSVTYSSVKTPSNAKVSGMDKATVSKIATKIVDQKSMVNKTDYASKIADNVSQMPDNVSKMSDNVSKMPDNVSKMSNNVSKISDNVSQMSDNVSKISDNVSQMSDNVSKIAVKKAPIHKTDKVLMEIKPIKKIDPKLTRKSIAVFQKPTNIPSQSTRKSFMPNMDSYTQESVFDRLYKPKSAPKANDGNDAEKLRKDPNYVKKAIKNSGLILKRHTCFETKPAEQPVRRSISAVHFKRISKNELGNCIHKWASIGDKLNEQHLKIDEAETVKEDCVVSAVKSERKKVKFMTPIANTPRPDELQARLKSWLQKRGKSLDSYHHLQCFGIHHLYKKPLHEPPKMESYDEENKENIALDSDSDDGSYVENMNEGKDTERDKIDVDKWRQTSFVESEFNDTGDLNETTVTSADTFINVDDILIGALNDLAELLKEGFDWEQSARYLRAIRERFPPAPRTAAYWECRAALEERRGDLHASVQCWEEAIAKGTEHKVAEASLDALLNKFMQLKISPNSKAAARKLDPKMVDVKNVFKSTIIRFAVQQAKLRQSETAVFTVTPVRRSGRLSHCPTPNVAHTPRLGKRTPLRLFDSVRQVTTPQHVFVPNDNLVHTP